MKLSQYNSSKITILNTILIIMVLYIHSYYEEAVNFPTALALERLLGTHGLSHVANLLFFTISGFLFFNGIESAKQCFPKIRKRVRTLLVPYLIWNVIFVLWYVILNAIPGVGKYLNLNPTEIFSSFKEAIIGLYWKPASHQLWFIRDLMIFVALSPIIYYWVKYAKMYGCLLLFVISIFFDINCTAYFVLGAYIALHSNLDNVSRIITKKMFAICTTLWILVSLYRSFMPADYVPDRYMNIVFELNSLVAVWGGYDHLSRGRILTQNPFWKAVTGYSFFVYLFHIPVINFIKKGGLILAGTSTISLCLMFLITPLVMMLVVKITSDVMRKFVPKTYSVLTGGR